MAIGKIACLVRLSQTAITVILLVPDLVRLKGLSMTELEQA